jgi:hypothetical protein
MTGEWLTRYAHLLELDARLSSLGGWRAMSPWWLDTVARLYAAEPHIAIGRVGRRGGKSSTWCRVAVAEATAGTWEIPPDDVGIYTIMSADKDQAKARVASCVAICHALEIKHEATAFEVRFPEHQTAIQVKAANVKGAVSSTCIGALLDEMALWQDDRGANPAGTILDMLMPSFATQPGAFPMLLSAPWTTRDPHAVEYDREGEGRFTVHGPTWLANPSLTEAMCRKRARNEAEFMRQYAAMPLDAAGGFAFPPSMIARAMGER